MHSMLVLNNINAIRRELVSAAFTALVVTGAAAQADTITLHIGYGAGCDTTITLARLQELPRHSATVIGHDGEGSAYTGALLWEVLAAACPSVGAASKRERIAMAVRAEAVDGYRAVVALMEADSTFREAPVLLCWQKNGRALDTHDGPLQLIVPDDRRYARNVRKVKRLIVLTP